MTAHEFRFAVMLALTCAVVAVPLVVVKLWLHWPLWVEGLDVFPGGYVGYRFAKWKRTLP